MSKTEQSPTINTEWQTQFYSDFLSIDKPKRGICEIENRALTIRSGTDKGEVKLDDVIDIKITQPPKRLQTHFDKTFCIKFKLSDANNGILFIEYDKDRENIFAYEIFADLISNANSICNFTARKGGMKTQKAAHRTKLSIGEKSVIFNTSNNKNRIWLGDVVDINLERRKIGDHDVKKKTINVKHIQDKTQITTRIYIINKQKRNLFNRYIRKEYNKIKDALEKIDPSKNVIELIIGYYTTQDIEKTEKTLTKGHKSKFESIYEDAMEHGLVTNPSDGISLTQKGRLLANMELESVNQ